MEYTVLIVEDSDINRNILKKILSPQYKIEEAVEGKAALQILEKKYETISAIMLDLKMPIMDGFEVLKVINQDDRFRSIPVIVATGDNDNITESEALKLGAWDFVVKPYKPDIIKLRLEHAIERSKLNLFEKLRHQAEHDDLTGLYNAKRFYISTREMLDNYPNENFVMVRFDIDRFKQYNALYGVSAGDNLLKFIARLLNRASSKYTECTYARIGNDVFAVCTKYSYCDMVRKDINRAQNMIGKFNPEFDLVVPFGIYFVDDKKVPVSEMLDRATLASRSCKGKYIDNVAVYTYEMGEEIRLEQSIISEMNTALEEEQFCVYYQPKYNIMTNTLIGAEALVRWKHPRKGLVSPGVFVPVFEKNGFIAKIDYFVWEKTCQYIKAWKSRGITPLPISVNVSRANMNNPNIVTVISNLVKKYGIDPKLLQLEITESAYMDNPEIMINVVKEFHEKGFVILMDDFGSGYSSLNTLKDIPVDVLKIDMKFLPTDSKNPKSEKILTSVIRMADWIGIPTIVEGVEKMAQSDYLKSIGCTYVQGYLYGKPMPVEDFFELLLSSQNNRADNSKIKDCGKFDALLTADPKTEAVLSGVPVPVVIYDYNVSENKLDRIRVNQCFYDVFGSEMKHESKELSGADYNILCSAAKTAATSHSYAECQISHKNKEENYDWYKVYLKYITHRQNRDIICAAFADITQEKQIERAMAQVSCRVNVDPNGANTILIVEDSKISRQMLKQMLENEYEILEAADGVEGSKLLEENAEKISLVMLDINMPKMNGIEFLRQKNKSLELCDIPVVIVSSDDAESMQVDMLRMGVNDYVTKPFVPDVTLKRIHNVLDYQNAINSVLGE